MYILYDDTGTIKFLSNEHILNYNYIHIDDQLSYKFIHGLELIQSYRVENGQLVNKVANFPLIENDVICPYPWMHLNIHPNGSVHACCVAQQQLGNVKKEPIEQIWNGIFINRMRLDMLRGAKSWSCEPCYKTEDLGATSIRQYALQSHGDLLQNAKYTNEDGSLDSFCINHIDVRFSNKCNLSCNICNVYNSSMWREDTKKLGQDVPDEKQLNSFHNQQHCISTLNKMLPTAKSVYFAGGEPLIMDEHYAALQFLIDNGKTDTLLQYNTNVKKILYKNYDIFEYWKHFDQVIVGASIDAFGPRAEYLRYGCQWDKIVNNLKQIKQHSNISLSVAITVSAHNALHVFDLIHYIQKNIGVEYNINWLHSPDEYSIKCIPQGIRDKILQRTKHFIPDQLQPLVEVAKQKANTNSFMEFVSKVNKLDAIREYSFIDTFPEYKDDWPIALQ